ncbi:MAG: DUF922 domain-containing protein [Pseudomonadota bacterium]
MTDQRQNAQTQKARTQNARTLTITQSENQTELWRRAAFVLIMTGLMAGLITSLLIALTTAVDARVIVKERTKYYAIRGKTGRDIFRSIGLRSKRGAGVQHAIATTTSNIRVSNVKTAIRRSRCVVVSAEVRLNLTYRYPRWRGRGASPAVRKAWKDFFAHAVRHENTHGSISKKYARRIYNELKRTTGRVSRQCSDFSSKARRKFARLSKNLDAEHRRFDRREARRWSRNVRLQRALALSR